MAESLILVPALQQQSRKDRIDLEFPNGVPVTGPGKFNKVLYADAVFVSQCDCEDCVHACFQDRNPTAHPHPTGTSLSLLAYGFMPADE